MGLEQKISVCEKKLARMTCLINQRIRNRLFEYLEIVVASESSSPSCGLNELISQWEDWILHPLSAESFQPPTFTAEESKALRKVDSAWNAFCKVTPKIIVDESATICLPEWITFVTMSRLALDVLKVRGKLPEDDESKTTTTQSDNKKYSCPCCYFRTLTERDSFNICPVCFWEDDGQDNADADIVRGGPNGSLSLTQARVNFKTFGACEEQNKLQVRLPKPEEMT